LPYISGTLNVVGINLNDSLKLKLKSPARQAATQHSGSRFAAARKNDITRYFTNVFNAPCANDAGPADNVEITLLNITFFGASGTNYTGWSGTDQLYVDGSGYADTSNIVLLIPTNDVITNMSATFESAGFFSGTLTGTFADGNHNLLTNADGSTNYTNTFYTTAGYPGDFNGADFTTTGGAPDWTYFTNGPAQEVAVNFASGDNFTVNSPVSTGQGNVSNLTIIIDLDRALRFYDGEKNTPWVNAVFYNGLASSFIMASFGTPGLIQGYQTEFIETNLQGYSIVAESGWMTLIFDATTNLLCGTLFSDDEGGTCSHGSIYSYTNNSGFVYAIWSDTWIVSGFQQQTVLSNIQVVSWTNIFTGNTNNPIGNGGSVAFQLLFQAD